MKKFLQVAFSMIVLALAVNVEAQQCNLTTPLIKYTTGSGIAPFSIDGLTSDWETNILGTGTGDATTPYNPPALSAANFSLDGTGATGPDLDGPTPPRDLRFFAFTYDNYNVYFYFRRIINSNSQNTFLYLMDINADGFMDAGEPVIRANFNSSTISSFAIHQYIPNTGADYVAGKGNYMTKPTNPNAGLADGYSVNGSFSAAVSLASFPLQANEVFAAQVTEGGYGVEFAVPWRYLRNWTNPGSSTPLSAGDVFTYHISTQNGTGSTVTSGAEDNAGGCCSGLATVGDAKFTTDNISVSEQTYLLKYRASIRMKNTGNAPAKVALDNVVLGGISNYLGRPVNETQFTVEGYVDANGNGSIDGTDATTLKTFNYTSGTYAAQPIIYTSPTPKDSISLAPLGTAYFLVEVTFPSNYSVKSLTATFGTSGVLDLPIGPCQQAGQIQQAPAIFSVTTALPVVFKSFTAVRNRTTVQLKWITATEIGNSGFAVERNINGTWQQIGWVPSQAQNGNSNADLTYTYVDDNNARGISQYRIRQVDFDAKSNYSEIRSVRGEGQLGKTIIYPNPSNNGKINIVFEDANSTRDISIADMSGRVVKQLKGITNNNITIENLNPGMYTVRIIVPETGEQVVEKVVVNKR